MTTVANAICEFLDEFRINYTSRETNSPKGLKVECVDCYKNKLKAHISICDGEVLFYFKFRAPPIHISAADPTMFDKLTELFKKWT